MQEKQNTTYFNSENMNTILSLALAAWILLLRPPCHEEKLTVRHVQATDHDEFVTLPLQAEKSHLLPPHGWHGEVPAGCSCKERVFLLGSYSTMTKAFLVKGERATPSICRAGHLLVPPEDTLHSIASCSKILHTADFFMPSTSSQWAGNLADSKDSKNLSQQLCISWFSYSSFLF